MDKFRFGCDPGTTDFRKLEYNQFVFGGAFAAFSRNMPPLAAIKLDEDIHWNLRRQAMIDARKRP